MRLGPALLCVLLACAALTVADTAQANTSCEEFRVCVDEITHRGNVELHVHNRRDYPITYSLRARPRGYAVEGPSSVSRVLGAGESEKTLTLVKRANAADSNYSLRFNWAVGRSDAQHDDDQLYALPYSPEKTYRVLQGYGSRFSHTGREEFSVDFDMKEGTPVHAARSGIVAKTESRHSRGCWEDGCGKYANYIVILHSDGTTGVYYHLLQNGVFVSEGDSVARGDKIGLSGNTGHTTRPHLHFGVYRATDSGRTQSISVRYQSADGIIDRPRRGGRYQAQ